MQFPIAKRMVGWKRRLGRPVAEPVEASATIRHWKNHRRRQVLRRVLRQAQQTPQQTPQVPALRQAQGPVMRTLASVEPGREVSVTGYVDNSSGQRRHLQAYGLLPGRRVRVLAQRPVTIVLIEQTELAFEGSVAASVLVGD